MPVALLTIGKLALLGLLYLFLWRVVRVIAADLRDPVDPSAATAAPRPSVARPERDTSRRAPSQLVLHPPVGAPRTLTLGDAPIVLGRAEHVDEVLDDTYASDEHAEIAPVAGEWRVRDLGSTNGTYLNGQKVIAPTPLAAGDQLQLGKTRIEVRR